MPIPRATTEDRIFSSIMAFMVLIVLCGIIFRVINEDTFRNKMLCEEETDFLDKNIIAVVTSQYRDSQNHNFPVVVLLRKKHEEKLYLTLEKSTLYGKLNLGDSLIKKKGQLEYEIVTKDKKIKGTASFGCDHNMQQESLVQFLDNKLFKIVFIIFIIMVPILILYQSLK